jgi:hypothetical protein
MEVGFNIGVLRAQDCHFAYNTAVEMAAGLTQAHITGIENTVFTDNEADSGEGYTMRLI